jgi:hypothetical protein
MTVAAVTWRILTVVSTGKDETKCGKVKHSKHIRRRQQNLLTKIAWGYWPIMNATPSFQSRKCLITDEMLSNIVHRTSQCVLVIHPNFSHKSSAKLTDRIAIKVFIGMF